MSHQNIIANILQAYTSDATYKSAEPELCLGVLPTSHNLGLLAVCHLSLYRGDGVVMMPRFDLEETLKTIQDFKIGRLWLVSWMMFPTQRHPFSVLVVVMVRLTNTSNSGSRPDCCHDEGAGSRGQVRLEQRRRCCCRLV